MNQDENFFTNLSEEEQIRELAIATKKGEAFTDEIMRLFGENKTNEVAVKLATEAPVLLAFTPKELEPAFNLLILILKKVDAASLTPIIKNLTEDILKAESTQKPQYLLTSLSNLYNNIDQRNASRYDVFLAMMKLSAKLGKFYILLPHLQNLDQWLVDWSIDNTKKREMYLFVSESLKPTHPLESHKYTIKYLQTFNSSNEQEIETAKPKARECIINAFSFQNVFQFDELPKLKVVQSLNTEFIFVLLTTFLTKGYKEYIDISKGKENEIASLGLSHENNCTKFRLITLATLATHQNRELSYSQIAEALNISESEVEKWVIQAIQSQLIDAKIEQLKNLVIVSRTTYRVFEKAQWVLLKDGLQEWKTNIGEILKVIQNAKLASSQGVLKTE